MQETVHAGLNGDLAPCFELNSTECIVLMSAGAQAIHVLEAAGTPVPSYLQDYADKGREQIEYAASRSCITELEVVGTALETYGRGLSTRFGRRLRRRSARRAFAMGCSLLAKAEELAGYLPEATTGP